jgi:misacylated tRNA(Ala) deacylase
MGASTEILFRDDSYLREAEAKIVALNERGGIILDRTIFYATSGGQPGDTGHLKREDGSRIEVAETITGETKNEIVHLPAPGQPAFEIGEKVVMAIDWDRRYRLMKMHTACHLLSVVCPYPITGAAVNENDSRVDFDLPGVEFSKDEITAKLNELVIANHPIFMRLISDEELAADPGLIKSKNVRPPVGNGHVRLVCIGDDASIDSQPCGGTHVAHTGEIGEIHIGKIEKKGRENRRFRIRFGPLPAV